MKIIRKNLFFSNKISPNLEKFSKFGVIFPVSNISPKDLSCNFNKDNFAHPLKITEITGQLLC